MSIQFRQANIEDLPDIILLLTQDELGQHRESHDSTHIHPNYLAAFKRIEPDPNNWHLLTCLKEQIIGVCQITIIPTLTFIGATRLQVEGVRVQQDFRGQGIGKAMMHEIEKIAKQHNASMIQLMTNKTRSEAIRFYESCNYVATHEGMKLHLTD